jgi:hypothetical protein
VNERAELIALIRENQRQVAALHELMQRQLELEEKRLEFYREQMSAENRSRQRTSNAEYAQGEDKP